MITRRLRCAMLALCPAIAHAQGYRIHLSASAQDLRFRGLQLDTVEAGLTRTAPSGGLETADGFAVRCGTGPFCHYYRPGAKLHAIPASVGAGGTFWGLGVTGLSIHASARMVTDLGSDSVWPASEPALQLLEGYAEYTRDRFTGRIGRQLASSRLESIGFDGAWLRTRFERASLDVSIYGGWGLGQAVAVSTLNAALNPLDEWRPRERQLVAGGDVAWAGTHVDARAEYRREVDPTDDYFVSERTALSFAARYGSVRANAGTEYNLAEGRAGTTDLSVTWFRPTLAVTGGARRYRPYFSLWTLWGAFSPVGYDAVSGSMEWRTTNVITLRARGERYVYDAAEVSTALVPELTDRGWRLTGGATVVLRPRWIVDGTVGLDRGPGAAGDFVDGSVRYSASERMSVSVYGGSMTRPLELRYYDAEGRWIGARIDWQAGAPQFWVDAMVTDDRRNRPDAGGSAFRHARIRAGASVAFGSGADRTPLPPAR